MQYQAFQGSQARKTEMAERVRTKWANRQVFPLSYLKWRTDGGMVSLSGALAETQDPELFVERTGLPVELGTLCEGLIYVGLEFFEDKDALLGLGMRGGDPIFSFAMEWIDAIPVGANLGGVVPRFMRSFLASVLANDFVMAVHVESSVRAAAERILDLWDRELGGEVVSGREWRAVRGDAVRASESSDDVWGYPIAEMVESLAWPVKGLASEFVPIFQLFAKPWGGFVASSYLSDDDRRLEIANMAGLRELTRAQRDPQFSQETEETLLDRLPEAKRAILASMEPEAKARTDEAKRKARPVTDMLLRAQMDNLLELIKQSDHNDEAKRI